MINKTRRSAIVDALVTELKAIKLDNGYATDLGDQVYNRMLFWDSITEFPAVCLAAGEEYLVHQGAGFKDRYLSITIRAYVNEEDPILALESLLEDIEVVIDNNGRLAYTDSSGDNNTTRDIIITLIETDQGALAPIGVGEISLQVKY